MNKNFEQNIISIYKEEGKQWLIDLPNIVDLIAQEWNLNSLKAVDNLSMNYVASGFQGSKAIILKISLDAELIRREYIALKALSGHGAVKVFNYKEKVLLLQKLSPAVSLKTYFPDSRIQALKIACEVTKKLHQASLPHNIKLPSLEEKFSLLDKDWPIAKDYLTKARIFRNKILNSSGPRVILHGDLHYDNILQDGNEWRVIDPHGVIGFPINEVWAFVQSPQEDLDFIARYFEFNLADLKKCYFMHVILSAVWAIEDNIDPQTWLMKAEKLEF